MKQFTGDGVMALFGAPQAREDHAPRAVRAALGIVARLEHLNVTLGKERLSRPCRSASAFTAGEVVAGLIGPDERVEYGVVGEAVNLAARVESLTKDVGTTILVSSEIASRLGAEFTAGTNGIAAGEGQDRSGAGRRDPAARSFRLRSRRAAQSRRNIRAPVSPSIYALLL